MIEIEARDLMGRQAFVSAFDEVFEGSPWLADRAWPSRPFDGRASLHSAMANVVRSATCEERLALLRAHSELAGGPRRSDDGGLRQ
jgi:2-oxo-4-hydroxy-4-carboxy--5-ureidoimidazoline (OHCU) decarboxylase